MDVNALELVLTDADLAALISKHAPADLTVEDLKVVFRPEGICVTGSYPMLVRVNFECWWTAEVTAGKVRCMISKLKAMGMPAMVFKSAVVKVLESFAKDEFWIAIDGETVVLDPEFLLARYVAPGHLNLKAIALGEGTATVTSGR
ncbi:MAG TPA: hypothetical protein VHR72_10315 [Gemmataceae bacterium]|jgi:hypothetical protein|nr:hypothetical protein [Gemmataceae bacterium]